VASGNTTIYLKFPWINSSSSDKYPTVVMNFSVLKRFPPSAPTATSHFNTVIYKNDTTFIFEIDISLNHGKLAIIDKAMVYYTEAGSNYYYLKMTFKNEGSSDDYIDVNYDDVSTNDAIPASFSYNNMVLNELPQTEQTYSNSTLYFRSSLLDIVRPGNGAKSFAFTSWSAQNPGNTYEHLYPGTKTSWASSPITVVSGVYAWEYSGQ
jgi:hypothetical protein